MSKAALNMYIKCLSVELKSKIRTPQKGARPVIALALHPGTVDTDLSQPFQKNVKPGSLFTPDHSANQLITNVLEKATLKESGSLFAYDGSIIPF